MKDKKYREIFKNKVTHLVNRWMSKNFKIDGVQIKQIHTIKKNVPKKFFACIASLAHNSDYPYGLEYNIHKNSTVQEQINSFRSKPGCIRQILYYNYNYEQSPLQMPLNQLIIHECAHLLDNRYNLTYIFKLLVEHKDQYKEMMNQIHKKSPIYSTQDIAELFAETYRLYYYNRLTKKSKELFSKFLQENVVD